MVSSSLESDLRPPPQNYNAKNVVGKKVFALCYSISVHTIGKVHGNGSIIEYELQQQQQQQHKCAKSPL